MIKIRDLNHIVLDATDPRRTSDFMADFGLSPVEARDDRAVLRGMGPQPWIYVAERAEHAGLRALGFAVDSAEDLARATALPGAGPEQALDRPGGGRVVCLTAPGGLVVELVHGVAATPPLPARPAMPFNDGDHKRRVNGRQVPPRTAAEILRLGHVALMVPDPTALRDWLQQHFGMLVSDTLLVPDSGGQPLGFFMRLDQGAQPADHHTLLVAQGEATGLHHASFELQDVDGVWMGHEWMRQRGHRHHWGVGRHVLGSQVFDYWWDPDGLRMEHYADGDVWDNTVRGVTVEATEDQLYVWGPPVPAAFFAEQPHA
jgi:catechol 2,3-dioxygenase-like lactoylglutathione lyase family enzyme